MNKTSLHAYISGRVQGVFFRQGTRNKAIELGLTGWVRNLQDGRVEVFASGEIDQITALEKWLWQGPPAAKVVDVSSKQEPYKEFIDFKIT